MLHFFIPWQSVRQSKLVARTVAFIALLAAAFLCSLALHVSAFAEDAEATADTPAPEPRVADLTDRLKLDSIALQKKTGSTWQDVAEGEHLTNGAYVRIYITWSIDDMTGAEEGSTFTINVDGDDHFLAYDFGPEGLVDPTTSKVIGSYVVTGSHDQNGNPIPGPVSIVTTLSAEGAQFPSLHNGFFSLEGYVRGTGDDIVFTVNGEALPSFGIDPPSTAPLPGVPLMKYGSQVAGQNQIVWSMGVNLDNVVNAYKSYAQGNPQPSPKQGSLLLTDELQGGQAIASDKVVVYLPVQATTDDGVAQTQQYAAYPITDMFEKVDASSADGMTQDQFAYSVRFASKPTIGVWEGHVVYIGFGDVPTGDGSSALNMGKILDGRGDEALAALLTQNNVTTAQRDIITDYLATTGSNKGDFTSFIIEMRTDASETGQYQNTATLTYGDSSSETASGGAHFTVISGGVEVRDGKVVLTKVDADDASVVLPDAVFKLEKMQPDNSWAPVAGAERLTTGFDGTLTVTGLLLGQYRFVELSAPGGYELETAPVEFAIASSTPNHAVALTAENTKSPVLGDVQLMKRDAANPSVGLAGAVFKLEQQAADGTWTTLEGHDHLSTDQDGLIEVGDLPVGSYRFVEIEPPAGYIMADHAIEFAITPDGAGTVSLTADNEKSPVLRDLTLTKHDADDPNILLGGAVFRLEQQAADGTWAVLDGYERLTTNAQGVLEARALPVGSYRFVEVEAPDGYMLEETPLAFEVTDDATTPIALTAANEKSPVLGGATLVKRDAEDAGTTLAGAVFKLEALLGDGTWAEVAGYESLVTDDGGCIEVADLPVGSYRFVETQAPDGYQLDATPVLFDVAEGQTASRLTMDNTPLPPDPVDPVDPTDPADPSDPTEPQPPSTPMGSQEKPMANLASTGDALPLAAWGVLAAVAVGALATALRALRHRARRR